jgi:short-subunit dehydrogenase
MKAKQKPGVIINMGSAAGLYPMPVDPIYAASKGFMLLVSYCFFHLFIELYKDV